MPNGPRKVSQAAKGHPIDEPVLIEPGVHYREADTPGSAKHLVDALPPEHPLRRAKGDLGFENIPHHSPRFSFEGGNQPPWKNLKGGK